MGGAVCWNRHLLLLPLPSREIHCRQHCMQWTWNTHTHTPYHHPKIKDRHTFGDPSLPVKRNAQTHPRYALVSVGTGWWSFFWLCVMLSQWLKTHPIITKIYKYTEWRWHSSHWKLCDSGFPELRRGGGKPLRWGTSSSVGLARSTGFPARASTHFPPQCRAVLGEHLVQEYFFLRKSLQCISKCLIQDTTQLYFIKAKTKLSKICPWNHLFSFNPHKI